MQIDIEKLSLEELLDLNRRIVRRIEYLHGLKTRANLDRFEVGDRVSFQSDGHPVMGLVVRVNQKTLSIRTKEAHWNIHPRFVTKLPEAAGDTPSILDGLLYGKDRKQS
jgi:hypothetical protein